MIIVIALIAGLGVWIIWKLICYGKTHHRRQPTLQERKQDTDAGVSPIKAKQLRHVAGLPVPKGVPTDVVVYVNRLCMKASGQLFQIPMERVCEVQRYSDTQLMNSVESSLFQTALGAAAFGSTGAVIGAMPESHFRRIVSKYNLLLSYLAEDGSRKEVLLTSDVPILGLQRVIEKHKSGVMEWKPTVL